MQETQEMRVCSLGWEEPLEKEMATRSSILAWRIPWTEEPGGLFHGVTKELAVAESLSTHAHIPSRKWQIPPQWFTLLRRLYFKGECIEHYNSLRSNLQRARSGLPEGKIMVRKVVLEDGGVEGNWHNWKVGYESGTKTGTLTYVSIQ